MKRLDEHFWKKFLINKEIGSSRFDGKKFESLVKDLLDTLFDGEWEKTPDTWDGGKDFVNLSNEDFLQWVECKMFKDPISIKVISNTLVMAVNDQVDWIGVFSYSPLNQNARDHLANFSSTSNIDIHVFDDLLLEELIFSAPTVQKKYFPSAENYSHQNKVLDFKTFFTSSVHIERAQILEKGTLQKTRKNKISLNSPCLFEIVIHSYLGSRNQIVDLDISDLILERPVINILNQKYFSIEAQKIKLNLAPGQVLSVKLYIKFNQVGKQVLPAIKIFSNSKYIAKTKPVRVEVSRLVQPPLVGGRIYRLINEFDKKISSISETNALSISGRSGVGKSRLLEEYKAKLLANNFIIKSFDGRSRAARSFRDFARDILSGVWKLPISIDIEEGKENFELDATNKSTIFDRVSSILYNRWVFSTELIFREVVDLIVQGLTKQRIALLFDNIQALDNTSIKLIREIIDRVVSRPGQCSILMAFNLDDLVFSNEASTFYFDIKYRYALDKNIDFVELPDFSKTEVVEFLDTMLKYSSGDSTRFTIDYPRLTEKIQKKILSRPFDLFQTLKAAEELDIARVEDGFFYVKEFDGFNELINTVNGSTETLLDLRIQKLSTNNRYNKILHLISYLGDIQYQELLKFGVDEKDIQLLINGGFIKEYGGGKIDFYHPSIEKYYTSKILTPNFFSETLEADIHQSFNESGCSDLFPIAKAIIEAPKSEKAFKVGLQIIKEYKGFPKNSKLQLLSEISLRFISKNRSHLHPDSYMFAAERMCKYAANDNTYDFVEKMKSIHHIVSKNKSHIDANYYKLIRQIASYSSSIKKPYYGISLLEKEIKNFDQISPNPTNSQLKIKADLLNRLCVCYKSGFKTQKALTAGLDSLNISKGVGAHDLFCLNLIDIGYIYYGDGQKKEALLYHWDKATQYGTQHFSFLEKHYNEISTAINLVEAKTLGLRKNFIESIILLNKIIIKSKSEGNSYYLIQGLLTKAIISCIQILTLEPKKITGKLDEVFLIAKSVEDLSIISGYHKFYISALYLQSIILKYQKKPSKSSRLFDILIEDVITRFNQSKLTYTDLAIINEALLKRNEDINELILKTLFAIKSHYTDHEIVETTFCFEDQNFPLP